MNQKLIFTLVVLAVVIVVSGCGAPTAATQVPSEQPTQPQVQPTEAQTQATEPPVPPTEAPQATEPPAPSPTGPMIPTADKPPLSFLQPVADVNPDTDLQPVIGYTFPAGTQLWTVPLKAAAFANITPAPPGEKTKVGLVEIGGEDQNISGTYEVWIDLASGAGELRPLKAASLQGIEFDRIPQTVNPARAEAPFNDFAQIQTVPSSAAAINASGVCFVVKEDPDKPDYTRYCSKPNSVLSVNANFADQYGSLKNSIQEASKELPPEIQNAILYDLIISEMEDPEHLVGCKSQIDKLAGTEPTKDAQQGLESACSSDITLAPLSSQIPVETQPKSLLEPGYGQFMFASVLNSLLRHDTLTPKAVAVVQVLNQVNTQSGAIAPGTYRLDYWYIGDVFQSATLTGISEGVKDVVNQQIPAVPATFVNADGSEPPGAQISVCRVFGICTLFQKSCS